MYNLRHEDTVLYKDCYSFNVLISLNVLYYLKCVKKVIHEATDLYKGYDSFCKYIVISWNILYHFKMYKNRNM